MILKRPSHGKLKLANSCWQTSKTWQTRVKSQHTVICTNANVVPWHSGRLAACIVVLLYVNRRRRNMQKTLKKIERFGRNRISVEIPPFERRTRLVLVSLYAADETSHRSGQFWTSSINWKVASRSSRPSAILWRVTQTPWIERVLWLVDIYQHTFANRSHVKYEFTNTKKLVKKLARIKASSICCQRVCRLFLCRSHTPSWVC